jgi:cystathionine gamma-synthase
MTDDPHPHLRRSALIQSASRPLVTPIYPSVAYVSDTPDQLDAQYDGQSFGYTYAREGHPNADILAAQIDRLEGATGGVITGSGMGAISAALLAMLKAGDHVLAGNQLYGRSLRLLTQELPRLGISASLADPTDATQLAAAIKPETRAILIEVTSNPTLRIADMQAISRLAKLHDLILMVDNTFTTPRAFRPLDEGADIVIHSLTKLLSGHSDVTLGYVAAKDEAARRLIRDAVTTWGLTPSPYECWLAERGLYSFDLRFERAQQNAAALADHLATLDGVQSVLYPGRDDHPDHARAALILNGNYGNMVSFSVQGGRDAANALTRAAPQIAFAPTLGDISTTLSHPASSSHRALSGEEQARIGITEGFFRVSVGIENIEQLKAEFTTAILAAARATST